MMKLLERQNAELAVLRRENSEHKAILQRRKAHKTGKRVKLLGEFVFSTAEHKKIAREAEEATAAKRPYKRQHKRPMEEVEEEEEEEAIGNKFANSESEGSVIVVRNIQSRAK
jgi:hypothetical protein